MQWLGLLVTAVGLLIIGGYYFYELFLHLFTLEFMPFPVRLALPVVAVGVLTTLLSTFWGSVKRNRRERLREIEEELTEHSPERAYVASQLGGLDD